MPFADQGATLIKLIARILITALLFYLIFRSVDMKGVLEELKSIDAAFLALALLFQLLSTLVASYRWYLIMHLLGFGQTLYYYVGSYFKGTFFNQALPTSIGGDAVRVLDAGKIGKGHKEAFYGVFIDRVIGLSGLMLLNLIALIASPDLLPSGIQMLIGLIAVAGIVGVGVLLMLRHLQWLTRYKVTRMFHHISGRLALVFHTIRSTAAQTGLSLVIHFLTMASVFSVGKSLGMELPFLTFLVLVPPALLLTVIPVSLAGWGVRESAMIGLFLLLKSGVPEKTTVLSMSLVYGLLLIVVSIPGLYFYVTGHRHRDEIKATENAE